MKRIIFEEKDIVVTYEKYKDDRGEFFTIQQLDVIFSVGELPDLISYSSIQEMVIDYLFEKDMKIREDAKNAEESYKEEYEWEPGTEGF